MKAKNVTYPGSLIDRGNLIANWPSGTDVVTVSSTKGDFLHPNAFSYNVKRTTRLNGNIKGKNGYYGSPPYLRDRSWDMNGPVQPDVYVHTFQDIAYNKALSRLNEKVRGGLDLSVALAESGKTFAMIKSLAKFSRWFSGIGPKRWANEWLQLQYGWKPLLGDIYAIADESLNVVKASSYFKASAVDKPSLPRSRDLRSVDWTGASHFLSGGPPSIFYCDSKISGELLQLVKIGVNLKQPTSTTQLARWTSLNPLSIAWELTPYSFVVDWFYDIGGYLRDYETSLLYNSVFDYGYVSRLNFQAVSEEAYCNYMTTPSYFNKLDYINVRGWQRMASFSRTKLTSFPVPAKPVLTADLSATRLLSAAALLAQKLRR